MYVSTALFVEMKTPANCCFVVRIICAHNHNKRMASTSERLRTTSENVFKKKKNRVCSLIRACSLIRSNTVYIIPTQQPRGLCQLVALAYNLLLKISKKLLTNSANILRQSWRGDDRLHNGAKIDIVSK